MGSTKSFSLLVIAGAAWLNAFPAAAEEEKHSENPHSEKPKPRPATQDNNPARTPPVSAIISGAPASPHAPENHDTSDSGHPSFGESIVTNLLLGSSNSSAVNSLDAASPSPSSSPRFTGLSSWLDTHGHAEYGGAGLGNIVAHYPSSSASNLDLELVAGTRMKYAGIEAGYDWLGYYQATINSQLVDVKTEMYSLSLVGYLPLGGNADFFLKYGGAYWDVNASTNSGNSSPVMSGTNQMRGAGFEFRQEDMFIRIEKVIFRHVYQSDYYSLVTVRIGGYIH